SSPPPPLLRVEYHREGSIMVTPRHGRIERLAAILAAGMRRREVIPLFGGLPAASRVAAAAQNARHAPPRGDTVAAPQRDPVFEAYVSKFREELQKLGRIEGRNIQIGFRWGVLDDAEMRQRSAKELVALHPDLILTQNTPPTASMLQETHTVPVIFVVVADPVGSGFVKSLGRPGGNATAFTVMEPSITGKLVELLKEIAPRVNRAAIIFNPKTSPYRDVYLNPFKSAAASLGLEAIAASVHGTSELESVIAALA